MFKQLHSFHMLARYCAKSFHARLQQYKNRELPEVQAMFKKDIGTRGQIANNCWIIGKAREFQKKHLLHWLHYSLWLGGSQQTVEDSKRERNSRPPYLSPQEALCRTRSNSLNWTWKNGLVQNWERSTLILSVVTLLHAEHIMQDAGLDESTSWNQDCWEKYQQPQPCNYHKIPS